MAKKENAWEVFELHIFVNQDDFSMSYIEKSFHQKKPTKQTPQNYNSKKELFDVVQDLHRRYNEDGVEKGVRIFFNNKPTSLQSLSCVLLNVPQRLTHELTKPRKWFWSNK